ncbi:hypothetical protein LCGC14_1362150, partial [marine sediment metagenome]
PQVNLRFILQEFPAELVHIVGATRKLLQVLYDRHVDFALNVAVLEHFRQQPEQVSPRPLPISQPSIENCELSRVKHLSFSRKYPSDTTTEVCKMSAALWTPQVVQTKQNDRSKTDDQNPTQNITHGFLPFIASSPAPSVGRDLCEIRSVCAFFLSSNSWPLPPYFPETPNAPAPSWSA